LLEQVAESRGSLSFPMGGGLTQQQADALVEEGGEALWGACGCDLLTQAPEITTWLLGLAPTERLVCGCYAYLDGALFVRIAVAMDAIAQALVARRPSTTLAFLGTPTDCHLVPATARAAAGACVHTCIVHAWLPPWRHPLWLWTTARCRMDTHCHVVVSMALAPHATMTVDIHTTRLCHAHRWRQSALTDPGAHGRMCMHLVYLLAAGAQAAIGAQARGESKTAT
jgi:hypothetical protein